MGDTHSRWEQGNLLFYDTHRKRLLDAVWDYDEPPLTRTVDMHVAKLRRKIEDRPGEPQYIVTVHRLGYKFNG